MNYKNFSKSKKINFVRKDNSKGTVDIKYFIDKFEKMKAAAVAGGGGGVQAGRHLGRAPLLRTVANNQSIYKTH